MVIFCHCLFFVQFYSCFYKEKGFLSLHCIWAGGRRPPGMAQPTPWTGGGGGDDDDDDDDNDPSGDNDDNDPGGDNVIRLHL